MEITKGIKTAQNLCLLPGVFLIVSGLLLLFLPIPASVLFDIQDMEMLKNPFALAMGIRQFSIGLTMCVLALSNKTKALSYVMIIGSIVPMTDFFVFAPTIGWVPALRHAASVPLVLGLGVYLLSQMRKVGDQGERGKK